jgi:hypothetical protein
MLLIHWSKHNQTGKILKNGIRLSTKKMSDNSSIDGIWCFPYTRNKTLNTRWKSLLKKDRPTSNYNGFVFKLEAADFPIYAGDFGAISSFPPSKLFETYDLFAEKYGYYFSPKNLSMEFNNQNEVSGVPDYFDFEIVITKSIKASRIIKVLKDRDLK